MQKLIALMLAVGMTSCCCGWRKPERKPDPAVPPIDVVETAAGATQFTTLTAAIQAAGLEKALSEVGPFTVFAPTDAAFAALPEGALDGLLADPDALAAVLKYHVVSGELLSSGLFDGARVPTLNGASLSVRLEGDAVFVNDARVQSPDIRATNGVVHQIDRVLTP